ncbi:MAG: hypothetical protein KJ904_14435 [Alphaproteobacteria bacterium]|nr:hypothetical protein [Alphaproteobacteria bacterium]MBU0796977.1 hypothetical protein [Alphaproteobacteria bacterium]MBU0888352.1 hypothetical protein [Alphaproteobacteria bacterium]MBU1814663.1 hypothetical protein [Alphaproteobacteria bacterium]MBU2091992.1 hypothetical protein [Alphaproteobacteria bacterium]
MPPDAPPHAPWRQRPKNPRPPDLPRQPAGFTALPAEPAESDPVTDAFDAGRIEGKLRKRRASGFGALVEREPEMVAKLLSGLIRDDRNR